MVRMNLYPRHPTPAPETLIQALPLLQVVSALAYTATMVKVACMLLVELGAFPLVCGWWLDICTLPLLDASLSMRIEFWHQVGVIRVKVVYVAVCSGGGNR